MESIESYETYEKSMTHTHTMIKATATWCGPCQKIHPKIVELANDPKYKDITFYEYDTLYRKTMFNNVNKNGLLEHLNNVKACFEQ